MNDALWHYLELRRQRGPLKSLRAQPIILTLLLPALAFYALDPPALGTYLCFVLYLAQLAVPAIILLTGVSTLQSLRQGKSLDEMLEAGLQPRAIIDTIALHSLITAVRLGLPILPMLLPATLAIPSFERLEWLKSVGWAVGGSWTALLGLVYVGFALVASGRRRAILPGVLLAEAIAAVWWCDSSGWILAGASVSVVVMARLIAIANVTSTPPRVRRLKVLRSKLSDNPIVAREESRWLRNPWRGLGLLALYLQPVLIALYDGSRGESRDGALALYSWSHGRMDEVICWWSLPILLQAFWLPAWRTLRAVLKEREGKTWEALIQSSLSADEFLSGWRRVAMAPVQRLLLAHAPIAVIALSYFPHPAVVLLIMLLAGLLVSVGGYATNLGLSISMASRNSRDAAARLVGSFIVGLGTLGGAAFLASAGERLLEDAGILQPSSFWFVVGLLALQTTISSLAWIGLSRTLDRQGWAAGEAVPLRFVRPLLFVLLASSSVSLGRSGMHVSDAIIYSILVSTPLWLLVKPLEDWLLRCRRSAWAAWLLLGSLGCLMAYCICKFMLAPFALGGSIWREVLTGSGASWVVTLGCWLRASDATTPASFPAMQLTGRLLRGVLISSCVVTLTYAGLLVAYRVPEKLPQEWLDIEARVERGQKARRLWLSSHPLHVPAPGQRLDLVKPSWPFYNYFVKEEDPQTYSRWIADLVELERYFESSDWVPFLPNDGRGRYDDHSQRESYRQAFFRGAEFCERTKQRGLKLRLLRLALNPALTTWSFDRFNNWTEMDRKGEFANHLVEMLEFNRTRALALEDEITATDIDKSQCSLSMYSNTRAAGGWPAWHEAQKYWAVCSYLKKRREAITTHGSHDTETDDGLDFLHFRMLYQADLPGPDLSEYNQLLRRVRTHRLDRVL